MKRLTQANEVHPKFGVLAAAVLLCSAMASAATAPAYSVIAPFNGTNGSAPANGSLAVDSMGNFWGTTSVGGENASGAIFEATPTGTITAVYSFCPGTNCTDGSTPEGGLVIGPDGNLYGTTADGGVNDLGTVFQFSPASGVLTTLHSFTGADGQNPNATLTLGSDGNFYGTTPAGGTNSSGTAFAITPSGTFTLLYNFCLASACTDGGSPSGLVEASDGNYYGTAQTGGAFNNGAIFQLTPAGVLNTIYSFCSSSTCTDGDTPSANLMIGSDGAFYGTTAGGNTVTFGTIFRFVPGGALTTLYTMCLQATCLDGNAPSQLLQASDGNFYGTTQGGGVNSSGTAFRLTPAGVFTTLYNFCGTANCADGAAPFAGLAQGADGNLYGTANQGGPTNDGVIYSLAISTAPPVPVITGVGSGASFLAGVVPGSWITIVGTNLSPVVDNWVNYIVNATFPTTYDGVSVTVGGQQAWIDYISPTQINAICPNVGSGNVDVTVTTPLGTSTASMAVAATFQPAFFQWGTYAVATHQDYTYAAKNGAISGVTTIPAAPGDVLFLWGTGFGPTNPAVDPSMETPSDQTYYTANPVTIMIGTTAATVYGTALSPGFGALYQVAIQVPQGLADGDYPVVASVGGVDSPNNVMLTVQSH